MYFIHVNQYQHFEKPILITRRLSQGNHLVKINSEHFVVFIFFRCPKGNTIPMQMTSPKEQPVPNMNTEPSVTPVSPTSPLTALTVHDKKPSRQPVMTSQIENVHVTSSLKEESPLQVLPSGSYECKDTSEFCQLWKEHGRCSDSMASYMARFCKFSCGKCNEAIATGIPSKTTTISRPLSTKGRKSMITTRHTTTTKFSLTRSIVTHLASKTTARAKPLSTTTTTTPRMTTPVFLTTILPMLTSKATLGMKKSSSKMATLPVPVRSSLSSETRLCVDHGSDCQRLAQSGECTGNFDWMSINCRHSCSFCMPTTHGGAVLTQLTTRWRFLVTYLSSTTSRSSTSLHRESTSSLPCVDKYHGCAQLRSVGKCTIGWTWMMLNCRLSCRFCEPTRGRTPVSKANPAPVSVFPVSRLISPRVGIRIRGVKG